MCTVVLLRRPSHRWPIIFAANRDELESRPWLPPGRHWPDRANLTAGQDRLAGGSWLGVNDDGLVAGILNRRDSLGADPDLRSRGELVLEALDHADAADAAKALGHLDGRGWRSFNLVVADSRDAYWLKSTGAAGDGRIETHVIPPGLSMITAYDMNDRKSARIRHFRPLFEDAPAPQPERGLWSGWEALMASRRFAAGADAAEAMCIQRPGGFGTLSSSLIALAAPEAPKPWKIWRFAAGRPGEAGYESIEF
jgi:uncharacterized protein with NRDE domain